MLKKFWNMTGEYKKAAILSPVTVSIEVLMDIIIPLLMASVIDEGISAGNMNIIVRNGMLLILMCMVSLVSGFFAGHFAARASTGFAKNLRKNLYKKIQEFSFANIDHFSSTSLVTRLTTDVTNIQNAFQMIIRMCVRAPLMIIFSVVMVLSINASLALVFVAAIPLLAVGLIIIVLKANKIFKRIFKLYDRLNTVVQENLRGMRVVKSYVREEHETGKFKKSSDDIYKNFVRAEKILVFNSPLMQFCMYGCTLLICWFGAQMIVSETFTTGQLMSLLTYTTQILMSLMGLSMVFVMVTMSQASIRRVMEVLEEKSSMRNKENAVTDIPDGAVEFDHVSFGYKGEDGKLCLKDVNLRIESGQTVGIIGGTGSGKTSLVQLIPRLYDVTRGTVRIGGVDARDYDMDALRGGALAVGGIGGLTLGAIATFLQLTKSFSMPIGQMSQQINSVIMALAGAERIFDLMDEQPEEDHGYVTLVHAKLQPDGSLVESEVRTGVWAWKHPHKDGVLTYTQVKGDIVLDDVDFSYDGEKTILHNVSVYAKPGQKVAFVGATGAGKTTITNLINRFYDIADGKIRYDGININKIKKRPASLSWHCFTGYKSFYWNSARKHPLRKAGCDR